MKTTGYVFVGLGAAFILSGLTLLALGGSVINYVTLVCGGIITANGITVVVGAKEIERMDRQFGKY